MRLAPSPNHVAANLIAHFELVLTVNVIVVFTRACALAIALGAKGCVSWKLS